MSARLCHGVDKNWGEKGDDADQVVGSTVTEIGGREAFELVEKASDELSGIDTARFGFPVLFRLTVGEKIVGAKGEIIVLGRLFDHDPSYKLARRFRLLPLGTLPYCSFCCSHDLLCFSCIKSLSCNLTLAICKSSILDNKVCRSLS